MFLNRIHIKLLVIGINLQKFDLCKRNPLRKFWMKFITFINLLSNFCYLTIVVFFSEVTLGFSDLYAKISSSILCYLHLSLFLQKVL